MIIFEDYNKQDPKSASTYSKLFKGHGQCLKSVFNYVPAFVFEQQHDTDLDMSRTGLDLLFHLCDPKHLNIQFNELSNDWF